MWDVEPIVYEERLTVFFLPFADQHNHMYINRKIRNDVKAQASVYSYVHGLLMLFIYLYKSIGLFTFTKENVSIKSPLYDTSHGSTVLAISRSRRMPQFA